MGITRALALIGALSRFHIVFIAVGGSLVFGWLLTGEFRWALAALVGVDWFLVNLINRVVDRVEDRANRIAASESAERHPRAIYATSTLVYVLSFSVHLFWAPQLLWPRLAYHALGILYNFKLLPGKAGRWRLKDAYILKNSASNVGFLITLFAYPLCAYPLGDGLDVLYVIALIAYFAPFELSFEIIYDLRDRHGDAIAGVRSYPVVHGERFAERFVIFLNIMAIYAGLLVGAFGIFAWKEVILVAAPLVLLALFVPSAKRGITAADCVRITWSFAAMLIGYVAWVLLGLPLELPIQTTPALVVEIGLLAIGVIQYLWLKDFYGARRYWMIYVLIAVSAWLAEQSAISLYEFYRYAPDWHGFAGDVPLAVILIWPMVLMSTHWLTRRTGMHGARNIVFGMALVAVEAALMEVICVQADLWHWEGRGLFGVPLIGILGWALFAAGPLMLMKSERKRVLVWMPLVGLLTTHAGLQMLWRAGFKRISYAEIPDAWALAFTGTLVIAATWAAFKQRGRLRIAMGEVLPRILAAQLIFYLLLVSNPSSSVLLFCLFFVFPYFALFSLEWRTKAVVSLQRNA